MLFLLEEFFTFSIYSVLLSPELAQGCAVRRKRKMKKMRVWNVAGAAMLCGIMAVMTSCSGKGKGAEGTEVLIETSEGDIVVRLYDDTPQHRDNFIRNVEAHAYDNRPFNRIVPDMVIQAGADEELAGETKTLPAEIHYPHYFHRQGVLAAAREPDSINPERCSSALQWYIVTGKKYSSAQLSELQALLYEGKVAARFEQLQRENAEELSALKATNHAAHQDLLNRLQVEAEEFLAKNPPRSYSDVQRQAYARIGGAPHLDGEYTIFGEVVEGMPIALRIGRTPVDAKERPRRNVFIKRVTIQ